MLWIGGKSLDNEVGRRIDAHCLRLGRVWRPLINMCVMSPPLVISRDDIDARVAILREGISCTIDDLRKEGVWRGSCVMAGSPEPIGRGARSRNGGMTNPRHDPTLDT